LYTKAVDIESNKRYFKEFIKNSLYTLAKRYLSISGLNGIKRGMAIAEHNLK